MSIFHYKTWMKWLWLLLASFIICSAIFISAIRIFTLFLNHQRAAVTTWASQIIGMPMQIGELKGAWNGVNPVVELDDVTLQTAGDASNVFIKKIAIAISTWDTLQWGKPLPTHIAVDGATLVVDQKELQRVLTHHQESGAILSNYRAGNDRVRTINKTHCLRCELCFSRRGSSETRREPIPGGSLPTSCRQKVSEEPPLRNARTAVPGTASYESNGAKQPNAIWSWLLTQTNVTVRDVNILWRGMNGKQLSLNNVSLDLKNSAAQHQIVGQASIGAKGSAPLHFIIQLSGLNAQQAAPVAKIYLQSKKINLLPLLAISPWHDLSMINQSLTQIANFQLWMNWQNDQWQNVIAQLQVNKTPMNLRWNPLARGWVLHAEQANGPMQFNVQLAPQKANALKHRAHAHVQWNAINIPVSMLANALPTSMPVFKDGIITKAKGSYTPATQQITLQATFNQLAMSAWKNMPAFSALSGQLQYANDELTVKSHSRDVEILYPSWMQQAIHLDAADFTLQLNDENGQWKVSVPSVALHGKLLNVVGHLTYQPGKINGYANFTVPSLSLLKDKFDIKMLEQYQFAGDLQNGVIRCNGVWQQCDVQAMLHHWQLQTSSMKEVAWGNTAHIKNNGITDWRINLDKAYWKDININNLNLHFHKSNKWSVGISGQVQSEEPNVWYTNLPVNVSAQLPLPLFSQGPISVNAKVKLDLATLKKHFPSAWWQYVSGMTWANVTAIIPKHWQQQATEVDIKSNLQGIAFKQLPAPFIKLQQQSAPLKAMIKFIPQQQMNAWFNYAGQAQGTMRWAFQNQQWNLMQGVFHLGQGPLLSAVGSGIYIDGQLPSVNYSDWQPLITKMISANKSSTNSISLKSIQLTVGQFSIWHQQFKQLQIHVNPIQQGYALQLQSPQISGQIIIPSQANNLWQIDLNNLVLAKMTSGAGDTQTINPANLPQLDLNIQSLNYGGKQLGHLQLTTSHLSDGLSFDSITLNASNYAISMNGWWRVINGQQTSSLNGDFRTANFGALLTSWNYPNLIHEAQCYFNYDLQWPGAPWQASSNKLTGKLQVQLQNGRIMRLSKSAQSDLMLGRMLNLMSLNFTNVLHKGFPFDQIVGDLTMQQGNATTQDMELTGSVADVMLRGDINFAKRWYNLQLDVTPHLTSSLPVVAGIAGGPVAGAVTWAANKIVGGTINDVFASNYHITGPWSSPSIQQIHHQGKSLAPVQSLSS